MSRDFIPHICGKAKINLPDTDCTECDRLEVRIKALEDTRLIQTDIVSGDDIIVVEYSEEEGSNEVIISADLSNYYTQAQVDHLLSQIGAYEEVDELPEIGDPNKIYLVPIAGGGYERWIYTDDGWKDLGSTHITLDKQSILNALGYEEATISMTDTDGVTTSQTILVEI